jgi:hypothetical protein
LHCTQSQHHPANPFQPSSCHAHRRSSPTSHRPAVFVSRFVLRERIPHNWLVAKVEVGVIVSRLGIAVCQVGSLCYSHERTNGPREGERRVERTMSRINRSLSPHQSQRKTLCWWWADINARAFWCRTASCEELIHGHSGDRYRSVLCEAVLRCIL